MANLFKFESIFAVCRSLSQRSALGDEVNGYFHNGFPGLRGSQRRLVGGTDVDLGPYRNSGCYGVPSLLQAVITSFEFSYRREQHSLYMETILDDHSSTQNADTRTVSTKTVRRI